MDFPEYFEKIKNVKPAVMPTDATTRQSFPIVPVVIPSIKGVGTFSFVNKFTALETCILNNKKVWGFHCLNDATVGVGTTKTLIINIKKCDPTATPKTTYYSTGAHNSWSRGLATDSIFKYFLSK